MLVAVMLDKMSNQSNNPPIPPSSSSSLGYSFFTGGFSTFTGALVSFFGSGACWAGCEPLESKLSSAILYLKL
jgi:hypothetical protein